MIFIDTGAFYARYAGGDEYHALAVKAWSDIGREGRMVTSNFVLNETVNLLSRRVGHGFAAERARTIYDSESFEILRSSERIEREALTLLEKFADQKVGFVDAVSFALMREARIAKAFTFDRHFEWAGFEMWPGK